MPGGRPPPRTPTTHALDQWIKGQPPPDRVLLPRSPLIPWHRYEIDIVLHGHASAVIRDFVGWRWIRKRTGRA